MSDRSVLVVCPSRVLAEALAGFLQKAGFRARSIAGSLADVCGTSQGRECATIVWLPDRFGATFGPDREIAELRDFMRQSPSSRVIVLGLGADADGPGADFQEAGAVALLPRDVGVRTLVSAIELIALGRRIFPTGSREGARYMERGEGLRFDRSRLRVLGEAEQGSDLGLPGSAPFSPDHGKPKRPVALSSRERETLEMLVRGLSNKQIARALRITEATVKVHVKALLRKTHASNRTQLAIWGWHTGDQRLSGATPPRTQEADPCDCP